VIEAIGAVATATAILFELPRHSRMNYERKAARLPHTKAPRIFVLGCKPQSHGRLAVNLISTHFEMIGRPEMIEPDVVTRSRRGKLKRGTLVSAGALILACCLSPAAQTPAGASHSSEISSTTASQAADSRAIPDCIISPDDVLSISVYDAPDVTGEYRVSPTGQIEIPLLAAPISAAGLTPTQLSDLISETYRKAEVYSHPRVTVAIKESRVHAIAIAGAVKKPQIYPVFGKTTLLDLLSQAEGLEDDAGSLAIVTRGDIATQILKSSGPCGTTSQPSFCDNPFSVDLSRLAETGDPHLNVDLYPGDRVTVQRAGIVYVVGAVNRPGGFPLKAGQEKMTVIQALALAEDLKPTAAQNRAMIIRKNPAATDGREEIAVNLTKVLEGHEHDTRLQANDILFVPDSAGKRALRRGAEAAVTAATWGLIYH
jgi:polysaccharide export outer membrane protein